MERAMGAGSGRSTPDLVGEIEDLKSKIETIHGRISEHQREMTALQGEVAQMEATRRSLLAELERRSRPTEDVRITDHALLRYVERVFKIDVDALKRQILTDGVTKGIENGASTITVNGIQFRVKDRSIVTVIGGDQNQRLSLLALELACCACKIRNSRPPAAVFTAFDDTLAGFAPA
jgi:hypothetical protein